jgi:hypothetical protein
MIGAEDPPRFLATRLPRRWRPGIARWHATPTCSMAANCAAINALACGGGIGVGVQRTWAPPWQIWPLTLDDHETAAAPSVTPDIITSTEAEQAQPAGVIPLRTPSHRAAKRS